MRKLLKKQGFAPEVLVTDKLRSYGAAKSEIGLSARHDQGLRANNRAEIQTALRKQIFDVAIAEGETQIQPNGVPDNRRRKLMAGKRDRHALSYQTTRCALTFA